MSQHCFCGPVLESLSHLLFACPLAQSVLSWLQSLMFRYSPMFPVLLLRHVLFGFNLEELRLLPRVFVYILNVCKFCIWLARNDFRFRSLQPGAIPVIESVKARAKFHLTVFFKHQRTARNCRFFTRRWGANGVIASFAGGNLTFALELRFFCNFYFVCLPTSPCFVYFYITYVIVFMLVGVGFDSQASLACWCTPI